MNNTLLVIDGNAIMHRAYHAIPPFRTKQGQVTNVIYGFFSMLAGALRDFSPTHLVITFDTPVQTFRQKMLPAYQAHRPKIDDDFISQIPHLKDLIDTAQISRFEKDGYEADDIIGTIAKRASEAGYKTLILTGDKDIMQLVNHNTFVISPQTGLSKIKLFDHDAVVEKLGVAPKNITDYKALAGDPSDNYKGAHGIGPKTANKLIDQFGTAENIVAHVDDVTPPKLQEKVATRIKDIEMSKKIATILTDVDVEIELDQMVWNGFNEALKQTLRDDYEMNSLIARLTNINSKAKKPAEKKVKKQKPEADTNQISLF